MAVPRLADSLHLTDGGMETTLIFQHGLELPDFAAFTVLANERGRAALREYYRAYLDVAERRALPIILDTPTWRANADWGERLGYSASGLDEANRDGASLVRDVVDCGRAEVVVSGCIGPRGDGYLADTLMTVEEAERYHAPQVRSLTAAGVDLISAITMTYADEASGIVRAAQSAGTPVVVSFTVETDGRLPSGQALADAVVQVDGDTGTGPLYYMVNCAHPSHFGHVIGDAPAGRVRGVRVNASARSHAELDEADELDPGDPAALAAEVAGLRGRGADLAVFGGCCGTDHRHVDALALALSD